MREDAGMLGDLDRSVAAFLGSLLPEGTAVRFDPPAALRDEDVLLDAFLYDIREARPPVADGTLTRDDEGHVTGWQPPVRRYRVSYLLTAWTGGGVLARGEHDLLGAILAGCAAVYELPRHCLHGVLAGAGEPLPLSCAAADRAADAALLWPQLGIGARTGLDLTIVAPVVPPLATGLAPAVRSVEYGVRRSPPPGQPAASRPGRPEQRITEG
jgi:hypothetical protein